MTSLLQPIEIDRPQRTGFGTGLAGAVGRRAAAEGITRTLVVTGASNAARDRAQRLLGRAARADDPGDLRG